MKRTLNVYLLGNHVGTLIQTTGGQLNFSYTPDWLKKPDNMPISQSLPLDPTVYRNKACQGYFTGTLPEEDTRKSIAKNLGISETNDFALLQAIGGECAGAVAFLQPDQTLSTSIKPQYKTLQADQLYNVLNQLTGKPLLAGEEDVRISLAGAQNKLVVCIRDGQMAIPLAETPSTHILKPAVAQYPDIVTNEAFCMRLARQLKLDCAAATANKIHHIEYLCITRYDRFFDNHNNIQRLHQEDFCQALGLPPSRKYQKERGPSLKQCFALLRQVSSTPILDLQKLLDAVIFNLLIGNADAHGKNFSLLYEEGTTRLAPLYDILSTRIYSQVTTDMAMSIGGQSHIDQVFPKHFDQLAEDTGLTAPLVRSRVIKLSKQLKSMLEHLDTYHPMQEQLAILIIKRCQTMLERFETEY